jgi:hypothetical protein
MKKLLVLLASVTAALSMTGCITSGGLAKTITALGKDERPMRFQISNPIYGFMIIERNMPPPVVLQPAPVNGGTNFIVLPR